MAKTIFPLSRLYTKIAFIFLGLLVVVGVGYLLVTTYISNRYIKEMNQRLHRHLAEHLVQETKPLVNGVPDTAATHDIMHSIMVINQSAEVYLLDTVGNIIDYVVPFTTVKRDQVDLEPVKHFLADENDQFILGDDPKSDSDINVFSAAPIYENDQLRGYAYVILAGAEQQAIMDTLQGSYMLKLGLGIFLFTLGGAIAIAFLVLLFFTRSLRKITASVRRFKEGDFKARIAEQDKGDLFELADTFNGMADKIEENIDQLKSLDRLKQELIANVSHDLRTPLSILRGYVETLSMKKETVSDKERDRYLDTIMDSSTKLSNLINQLFEYSKLESNQVKVNKESFFISELVNDMLSKYQLLARQKNIQIELDIPPNVPLVWADIALVERVIQNLIDNALKFTQEGGKINIALIGREEEVEIKITDNGPGIPVEKQSEIFERYQKGEAKNKTNKGHGLGLAIVKRILEFHQTSIKLNSQPGLGTTFWFSLPVSQNSLIDIK